MMTPAELEVVNTNYKLALAAAHRTYRAAGQRWVTQCGEARLACTSSGEAADAVQESIAFDAYCDASAMLHELQRSAPVTNTPPVAHAPPVLASAPVVVAVAAAPSNKRKTLDEWECPSCMMQLGESGVVPAVLSGCRPFAHIICMNCATALLDRKQAICVECRAPFVEARPLATFSNRDDPAVAETLAKKARGLSTFEQRIALLDINDAIIKQRVQFVATRLKKYIDGNSFASRANGRGGLKQNYVPPFDESNITLIVKHAKRIMGIRKCTLERLRVALEEKTREILPHLQALFGAQYVLTVGDARHNPTNRLSHLRYMHVRVARIASNN